MNRCPCGTPILEEAQWVIWGCCYACMRQPSGCEPSTLAETAAMVEQQLTVPGVPGTAFESYPDIVHNYTD